MIRLSKEAIDALSEAWFSDDDWDHPKINSSFFGGAHEKPILEWWKDRVLCKDIVVKIDREDFARFSEHGGSINRTWIGEIPPGQALLVGPRVFSNQEPEAVFRLRHAEAGWNDVETDAGIHSSSPPFFPAFDWEEFFPRTGLTETV